MTLLFAVTPAFFVYAPTLDDGHPDARVSACRLRLYFEHVQDGRRALWPGVACFVLAAGTGYTALVPLGCFFIGLLLARRPLKELVERCGGAGRARAVAGGNDDPLRRVSAYPRPSQFFASQGSVRMNALATLTFLGGVTVFPWMAVGKRVSPVVMFLALAAMYAPWPARVYPIWIAVLASAGRRDAGPVRAFRNEDSFCPAKTTVKHFCCCGLPATLLFFIVVGDMINARYILLAVPALYLVIFRETSERRLISMIVPTAFLVGAFWLMPISRSSMPIAIGSSKPSFHCSSRVFASGAARSPDCGFIWSRKASRALTTKDTKPAPADLVVRHAGFPFRYALSDRIEPLLIVLKNIHPRKSISRFGPSMPFPARACTTAALGLAPFTLVARAVRSN